MLPPTGLAFPRIVSLLKNYNNKIKYEVQNNTDVEEPNAPLYPGQKLNNLHLTTHTYPPDTQSVPSIKPMLPGVTLNNNYTEM